jgi:hypothetical protein
LVGKSHVRYCNETNLSAPLRGQLKRFWYKVNTSSVVMTLQNPFFHSLTFRPLVTCDVPMNPLKSLITPGPLFNELVIIYSSPRSEVRKTLTTNIPTEKVARAAPRACWAQRVPSQPAEPRTRRQQRRREKRGADRRGRRAGGRRS